MRGGGYWALRLLLGGVFLLSGVMKIRDPGAFAIEVANYQLAPQLAPWLAATLPAIELLSGALLVIGTRPWVRAAALLSSAMLLVFSVAVTSVVLRGINVSCGCFGGDTGPVTALTVLRDVALLLGAVGLYALGAASNAAAPGQPAAI